MVSHNMPLCDHAFDKIGIIFDKISDSKKDSGSLVLFKCLQDCRGVSILISGIKSQIEDFFVSIAGIIGVVLFQIIDRGVSGRTFFLLPENLIPSLHFGQKQRFLLWEKAFR